MTDYHKPVLLQESIDGLITDPNGVYVDVTFGGGGHSREILDRIDEGVLLAFDKDSEARGNFILDPRFTLVNHDFIFMKNFLRHYNHLPVHGILADLGVSSHQLDDPLRGFSFRYDSDLDMRMDTDVPFHAKKVLNEYKAEELQRIFSDYAEIRNARTLAQKIVEKRQEKEIISTLQLAAIAEECMFREWSKHKYLSQLFQAIRMEVNQEISALKSLLEQSAEVLIKGGRLVIISYHSIEDRLVKNFIRTGNFDGTLEKDIYGNPSLIFKQLNSKVISPCTDEIHENTRARSARMRIAERI
jgi:16S rRNA (cytosine1402-N4)-methyltransferase